MTPLIAIAGTVVLGYSAYSVPRNIRTARKARTQAASQATVPHINPATYGLVPAAELNTAFAGPDPEADRVMAATRAGDWRSGAAYLAAAGRDWDLRWYRLGQLAHTAAEDDTWLNTWRSERPGDPDAAVVHADALVSLAGTVRGGQQAKYTSAEQFEGFHRLLGEALPACYEAARLAPDDPSPWIVQLTIARGLSWAHQDFHAVWEQITARDPYHFGAHTSALQYWCAKWRGSRELMFDFAERSAAAAPWGSLLPVLRLWAIFEQRTADQSFEIYKQPFVTAAVDATLDAVAQVPTGHHRLPAVRHLLIEGLFRTERYAEAVEQFYAVDGFVGSPPWSYSGDAAKWYLHARTHCFTNWEKAGRPAVPAR